MSTNVGSIHYDLKLDTTKFDAATAGVSAKVSNFSDKFKSFGSDVVSSSVKAAAGIAALGAIMSPIISDATKRVDTLNNAPKVLQNLGFSAEASAKSMSILEQGIRGLPTSLDDATTALLSITAASGRGIEESTKLTLAFNNMALAGGKGPMEAQRALVQFTQALGRGKMGVQEFNTLSEVMPAQLNQVAKSMLGPTANISTLREALSGGNISMSQFADQIVTLNQQGGQGFASFAEQAKTATGGINTAFTNMRTALVRGMAQIIKSIGAENISKAVTTIGTSLEKVFKFIADNIDVVAVMVGTILVIAFTKLAIAVAAATWPVLAVAAAMGALYLAGKYLYENFKPQIDGIIAVIKQLWEMTKPVRDFIANQFVKAWNDLKNAFMQVKTALEPFMPQLKILAIIIGVVLVAPIVLLIGTLGLLVAIGIGVVTFIARLIGWIAQLGAWFLNLSITVSGAMNRFFVAVAQNTQAAINWLVGLPGRIWGALAGLGGMLWGLGSQMIQGLINGIQAQAGRVVQIMRDIASSAINAVKRFLGIRSPSRAFMSIGENMGLGLVEGIDSTMGDVQNSLANITTPPVNINPNRAGQMAGSAIGSQLTSNNSNSTVNIGTVQIDSQQTADYFFAKLSRNQELSARALTTQAGSLG